MKRTDELNVINDRDYFRAAMAKAKYKVRYRYEKVEYSKENLFSYIGFRKKSSKPNQLLGNGGTKFRFLGLFGF